MIIITKCSPNNSISIGISSGDSKIFASIESESGGQ